jgi:hypothetical protein
MNRHTNWRTKAEIYQITAARYPDQYGRGGSCLYWSLTLMGVLLEHGYRALSLVQTAWNSANIGNNRNLTVGATVKNTFPEALFFNGFLDEVHAVKGRAM